MKIKFVEKQVILMVCFIFLSSALTFAQEKDVVTTAGQVMGLNVAKKIVVVNEKTFIWDQNTLFFDEKGSPISITADRLAKGTLVSIEATWIKNKPLVIKKLSLLPK